MIRRPWELITDLFIVGSVTHSYETQNYKTIYNETACSYTNHAVKDVIAKVLFFLHLLYVRWGKEKSINCFLAGEKFCVLFDRYPRTDKRNLISLDV